MKIHSDVFHDLWVAELGNPETFLLHISAMCYVEEYCKNKILPMECLNLVAYRATFGAWKKISRKKAIAKLVDLGWWIRVDSGYYIPESNLFKYYRTGKKRMHPQRVRFQSLRKKAWAYLTERYGARCVYCGSTENLEIDHIKPISKGGTNDFENLQILCKQCNCIKSDNYGI